MIAIVLGALRRGVVVGGLLGGLLGLANRAIGEDERPFARYALDWVVGGAFLGLIAGGVRAVGETRRFRESRRHDNAAEEAPDPPPEADAPPPA